MKTKATPKKRKHAPGRPTKYSPQVLIKTQEYLDNCQDEYFDYHKTQGATSNTYERKIKVKLPTVEGLALFLKVHRDTVQEWGKQHPPFSVALAKLKEMQLERLIAGGLSGDYNPMITKLVLSANHGMKERVDNTTDDKPMPQPIINVHRDYSNNTDQRTTQAN